MAAGGVRRVLVPVIVWVLVLGVAGAAAVVVTRRVRAAQTVAAPQIYTVPASMGPVTVDISGSGTVQPVQTASVAAEVAGQVARVDVVLGQEVTAGQVLYTLTDTTGLAAQLALAKASLATAQASLATLEDPRASISQTTIADDQLHVQQDQGTIAQDETDLNNAKQAATADATVLSPDNGTIMAVNVADGQSLSPGTVVATLLPDATPQISVAVPEEDLSYLPVGTEATVVIPMQATAPAEVVALATLPSGTVTVDANGDVVASGGGKTASETQTESEYDLTLQFVQSPGNLPAGEAVQVNFQYQGDPPSSYTWSYPGSMVLPKTVDLTAQGTGTVTSVATVGEQVSAGQQVAAIDDPSAAQQVAQDTLKLEEDEAALGTAQLTLSQDQNPTPPSAASLQQAQAQITNDEVTVAKSEQDIASLTVTAPISGVVTAVNVQPGQNVTASTTGVTLNSSSLDVVAPVDEMDIGKVQVGQSVQVTVSAFPGTSYPGTVTAISPTSSGSSGVSMYPVTVVLKNTQNLRPGMSATATIQVASASGTLRVPAQAVTMAAGSTTGIIRVMQGSTPVARAVQVGLVGTDYDQILSGLQVGQLVVAGQATTTTTTGRGGAGGFRGGFAAFGGGGFAGGGPRGG